ncbi:hypothetical protein JOC94_002336 [Bacillus thermophilus]|uniref:Uncharacterized protein n=2 Tax=Siminovitchia TaxID=2837510 RepID=A0A429X9H3_SIMTE|nr:MULTISPECIES: hypothetical protein [Siminovitchia]MBM7715349.1 hypothetical protein [Siminovitchia thermophila]RST60127.1 hypothetical protein D5F11_008690 [Siminovitchia terrae]
MQQVYLKIHQSLGVIHIKIKELEEFLENNPQMSLAPSNPNEYVVNGILSLDIKNDTYGNIKDKFLIRIVIPKSFPKEIPTVYEVGNRFPKTLDFHTFSDSSLCLGSPLSLRKQIKDNPTLDGFICSCVIPYFYAIALKLQGKGSFVFGELYHGVEGLIQDYLEVFDLKYINQVIELLDILSQKPNRGNKKKCPCGCNRIVAKCSLHKKIVEYRDVMTRKEYATDKEIFTLIYDKWKENQMKKRRKLIPRV